MNNLHTRTPKEILELNKIPRVWKPAYVWPADNDGIVRVVGGHDNPNVAEHRRHREWLRAMGEEPGPIVNHVISAITIKEFHHEHFPMVSAYQGLSPMQAEFLDLVPGQLNVSNRSSIELLDPDSESEYSENDAEAPMEVSKNTNPFVITIPPLDASLDVSVCTAISPHFTFTSPTTPPRPMNPMSVTFSPIAVTEPFNPIWSATPIPSHTVPDESTPTHITTLEKLKEPRTPLSNFAPKDEGNCGLTLIDRLNVLKDLNAPGSPTSTSSDIPLRLMSIIDSEFKLFASAASRPADLCSDSSLTNFETLSSAVYVSSPQSSNTHIFPFAVDHCDGAMVLDRYESIDLVADGLVSWTNDKPDSMAADQDVDMVFYENANMSKIDNLMIDAAIVDASKVSAAVIFPQDDSPRPQKSKGVDELIIEEHASIVEEQAPIIDNSAPSINDKLALNVDKSVPMGPVAAWRRSTIRLKELGRKLLKPDLHEQQLIVAIEKVTKNIQVEGTVKSNSSVENNGNPPPLPPKDGPVTPPKPTFVSVSPISLGPGEQSLLYSRLEYMVCETANSFLVEQYLQGHIDQHTINRVVNSWASKNLPQVPEFRFNQATQRDLINANRRTMEFTGKCSANPVQLVANLRAWKSVIQDMDHRTFSIRDSAIRKMMYEIGEVLEMLNASVKTLQAFDKIRTSVHRYMFTPPGSPASPLII
ncbi:mRNA export protein mlo3 [Penicillium atrosanguineum]|uniref:mRNA export protein mlo3 n=1 Tax=Penicillium atrosanguineum TaxID=1132637 RepID=UPI002389BEE6|nr:mRNA export protein mlo3 [Penicillium atrosanguineum]KAJ5298419.1 mRNA export protein mlo3 [Penicillium atrosanguineum]